MDISEVAFSDCLPEIRSVRFAVFVDEQKVPAAMEMDEWDARSRHVLAMCEGEAVGTGRLLPDGHIGRLAVLKQWRGKGIGVLLMKELMRMGAEAGVGQFVLSAQSHAVPFYQRLGFSAWGEAYQEAGIPHVKMILKP